MVGRDTDTRTEPSITYQDKPSKTHHHQALSRVDLLDDRLRSLLHIRQERHEILVRLQQVFRPILLGNVQITSRRLEHLLRLCTNSLLAKMEKKSRKTRTAAAAATAAATATVSKITYTRTDLVQKTTT